MTTIIAICIFLVIGLPFIGSVMRRRGKTPPSWKYLKPFSMTWWVGAIPAFIGSVIASEPLHGFAEWATTFDAMAGGTDPSVLITMGLGAVGLRGKDG